ncbi:hypothetical protein [Coraliomargarita parva]|uniref:hypothetical protein n=1 Tax=Coraliomargarita parva TaxID=3014050 RepID=UPI0022B402E3|nr:hypothetical protein [Coraliomargarita parva]
MTFRPTAFQRVVLYLLLLGCLSWLLFMTCFKEYWGFWQSPATYSLLKKEYPGWFRDYIAHYYRPVEVGSFAYCACWLVVESRAFLRAARESRRVGLRGFSILSIVLCVGLILGIRSANNLIGWLDRGELHGSTYMQVRE